jgi:biopolymer transport protein ExbD
MADIAFLLLTFFLMTAVIDPHKGLPMILPEFTDRAINHNSRNIFSIHINSHNEFLVEEKTYPNLQMVAAEIQKFVLNNNKNAKLSESPEKALVSLKTDRGASHETFIYALDQIQKAYYELYAERANLSVKEFLDLDPKIPAHQAILKKAKQGLPMNISLAN